jgi:hypothetical protein
VQFRTGASVRIRSTAVPRFHSRRHDRLAAASHAICGMSGRSSCVAHGGPSVLVVARQRAADTELVSFGVPQHCPFVRVVEFSRVLVHRDCLRPGSHQTFDLISH